MRFSFVDAEKANFKISQLCAVMGVTRQGFYAFLRRSKGLRAVRRAELRQRVREVFDRSYGTYGSPRVQRVLIEDGYSVGKRTVEKIMQDLGLVARQKRQYRITTRPDPKHATVPNSLARRFVATRPDEVWVADITYIRTDQGWTYLAAIIDLYSRTVVGWSLSEDLSVALPLRALHNALRQRRPAKRLLHHSDRGCQYTSTRYRRALREANCDVSMSRKGNCWDNAVAEAFFSTLKTELVHRFRWTCLRQLRRHLFNYIEGFYNRERLHSTLGFRTPQQLLELAAAAA